ncbi:MAG: type II toxin-antitoxin system RelB/DinJ family antitoxin [Treponema sp.]|jgi:DNA-damage-inducible protein J|nr:type II toxin-antitoxin system RelB/DinJ family antitoxin [Treponema sp.]
MAQVTIRLDDNLMERADSLFEELGMNLSTAVNVFIRQTLRERKIPFTITAESKEGDRSVDMAAEGEPDYGEDDPRDPFYSEANIKWIMQSIERGKQGKYITKTIEELEAMADG